MSGEIEEFWQLPAERYVQLHRERSAPSPTSRIRGVVEG